MHRISDWNILVFYIMEKVFPTPFAEVSLPQDQVAQSLDRFHDIASSPSPDLVISGEPPAAVYHLS